MVRLKDSVDLAELTRCQSRGLTILQLAALFKLGRRRSKSALGDCALAECILEGSCMSGVSKLIDLGVSPTLALSGMSKLPHSTR